MIDELTSDLQGVRADSKAGCQSECGRFSMGTRAAGEPTISQPSWAEKSAYSVLGSATRHAASESTKAVKVCNLLQPITWADVLGVSTQLLQVSPQFTPLDPTH